MLRFNFLLEKLSYVFDCNEAFKCIWCVGESRYITMCNPYARGAILQKNKLLIVAIRYTYDHKE